MNCIIQQDLDAPDVDSDDDECNDHRAAPKQCTVDETIGEVDIAAALTSGSLSWVETNIDETFCPSSVEECHYSASCDSKSPGYSDSWRKGQKRKPLRHRRLSQKYEMMSPSSTDEIEDKTLPASGWPLAEDQASTEELHDYTQFELTTKGFISLKSEDSSKEFGVSNVSII